MTKRNAFYAQSGGVTAVINASAAGVIETARKHKDRIGKVYAGRNGIIGALTEDLIDTSRESRARDPRAAAHAGGRVRLVPLQAEGPRGEPRAVRAPDRGVPRARHRLLLLQRRQRFGRHLPQGVADLGDARLSARARCTCRRPSTTTCRSPTTARASARSPSTSPPRCARRRSTSRRWRKTSTKVFVLEVMGRHAGWITAAVGMADDAADADAARAAVPRDRRSTRPAFLAARRREGQGASATAASASPKGLQERRGQVAGRSRHEGRVRPRAAGRRRPARSRSSSRTSSSYKYHWAVADYLQRAARHIASKTDLEHSLRRRQGRGRARGRGPATP